MKMAREEGLLSPVLQNGYRTHVEGMNVTLSLLSSSYTCLKTIVIEYADALLLYFC